MQKNAQIESLMQKYRERIRKLELYKARRREIARKRIRKIKEKNQKHTMSISFEY